MCECMNQIKVIIMAHDAHEKKKRWAASALDSATAERIMLIRSGVITPIITSASESSTESGLDTSSDYVPGESGESEVEEPVSDVLDTDPESDPGSVDEEPVSEHDESEVNIDELREAERQEAFLREQIARLELDKMRTKGTRKKKD